MAALQYVQNEGTMIRRVELTVTTLLGMLMLASSGLSQDGNKQTNWQSISAANGAAFAVDPNSLSRLPNGNVWIVLCVLDKGTCHAQNLSRFEFDCRGPYLEVDRRGPLQIVPPQSVVRRVAEVACKGASEAAAKETRGAVS